MVTSLIFSVKDHYDFKFLPYVDPRTEKWFLVSSYPTAAFTATIIYLIVIKIGPKLMKNREPLDCRNVMVIYNFLLVLASLYMAVELYLSHRHGITCAVYNSETWKNPSELRMASVIWWYYFSKYVELFDTVLMILRKRNSQISWLHLIHHTVTLNALWWIVLYGPGGMSWCGCFLNSIVHTFMYAYYGLSAIPSCRSITDRWKQYITRIQLIQFGLLLAYTTFHFVNDCDYPMWGQLIHFAYGFLMVALFLNFYIQAYFKKRQSCTKAKQERVNGTALTDNNKNYSNTQISANGTAGHKKNL